MLIVDLLLVLPGIEKALHDADDIVQDSLDEWLPKNLDGRMMLLAL